MSLGRHRERGSLRAGCSPASLEASSRTPGLPFQRRPCGFYIGAFCEPRAWRPCGRWLGGPLPSSPALVSLPAAPNLLVANSRLYWRYLSLSHSATHLVSLTLGWARGRCRSFLEYGLLHSTTSLSRRHALSRSPAGARRTLPPVLGALSACPRRHWRRQGCDEQRPRAPLTDPCGHPLIGATQPAKLLAA